MIYHLHIFVMYILLQYITSPVVKCKRPEISRVINQLSMLHGSLNTDSQRKEQISHCGLWAASCSKLLHNNDMLFRQTLPCTPLPELPKVGSFLSYRCLVFPKKVLKGKSKYFGDIQVKRPKNVDFQHIHSNSIIINLTFLDNNE